MTLAVRPDRVLPDVLHVTATLHRDARGWFMEAQKDPDMLPHGIGPFAQTNHSHSRRAGTLRGLHHQIPPHVQGKLVRCLRGAIHDVALDLRPGPTRGTWTATTLRPDGGMLWVPPGFAHGFQTLEDGTEVLYHVTQPYAPAHEATIRWDSVGVAWPLEPILSDKDADAPAWGEAS